MPKSSKMKVLVIGGGLGGLTTCASLRKFDKHVEITLVEPKEYLEIHWASYRAIFDEDIANKATFEIKPWCVTKGLKYIRATVTKLEEDQCCATLSNGEQVEFNICVICTGAKTKYPALGRGPPSGKGKGSGDLARRLAQLQQERKKLMDSKSVVIVGGGLIGVEMAGDLAYYAEKEGKSTKNDIKITLVHSQPTLVPEFTPKASAMTLKKLENMGVTVILNDKVIREGGGAAAAGGEETTTRTTPTTTTLRLQKGGTVLNADQVIWTTGIQPCHIPFLKDKKFLDKHGWLQVDEYFRVKNNTIKPNTLFALGDCCDLLPNAGSQILGTMNVIGKNLKVCLDAIESGNEVDERKMRKAMRQPEVYCATLGKGTGVALMPMGHTQFVLPWLKNSTMFLFNPKKALDLKD